MKTHEHFREICAAASIGQATPEELFDLERHAAQCDTCGQAYFDYLNLAGEQFAMANQKLVLSSQQAQESLNSDLFTRRFFARAELEGIQFSAAVGQEVRQLAPVARPVSRRTAWRIPLKAIAAVVLLGLSLSGGYFYGKKAFREGHIGQVTGDRQGAVAESPETRIEALDRQIAKLTSGNFKLQTEIDELKAELRKANAQLSASDQKLESASQNRQELESQRDALDARLQNIQKELSESQAAVSNAQQVSAKLREHSGNLENMLVADRVKINELTDELVEKSAALDKERQLLALGHDVSDLMGARNLHIVDVVDTDPGGKTKPAFGRVFFTEGKSLVFYAYDLNDAKLQKANYQYRVWAKQEGGDKQVRSLGIFYADDKAQRRWVFKCNDAKILNVIDSVFVTLEPTESDPSHPKGQNLMYAYLRGQPNHP